MGRLASGVGALALVALAAAPAPAQSLATLHVRGFSIAADHTTVRAGEAFHIMLSAHVDEPVAELNNVTLPDLTGFDVSGDERRCHATARGSECSEILTLSAALPGDRIIGPWTMDAVDARNNRPSRYSSNTLVIHVAGPSVLESIGGTLREIATAALAALALVALVAILVRVVLRNRARRRAVAKAPFAAPLLDLPREPKAPLRDLVAELAREPTRARAVAVREALRESVGAREDETYADLIARRAIADGDTLLAFGAVERAAFCEDARVAEAAREALPFLMN